MAAKYRCSRSIIAKSQADNIGLLFCKGLIKRRAESRVPLGRLFKEVAQRRTQANPINSNL